jgi:hypothetical protein
LIAAKLGKDAGGLNSYLFGGRRREGWTTCNKRMLINTENEIRKLQTLWSEADGYG